MLLKCKFDPSDNKPCLHLCIQPSSSQALTDASQSDTPQFLRFCVREKSSAVCSCHRERWLICLFEVAINNRAPGQRDEARMGCDTLAQVDGWRCGGINECSQVCQHMWVRAVQMAWCHHYVAACMCVCVLLTITWWKKEWKMGSEHDWTPFFPKNMGEFVQKVGI